MIGAGKTRLISPPASLPPPVYSVDLSPGYATAIGDTGTLTTNNIYSTVNNGVGPYTYLWTIDAGDITIVTPTAQATAFRASGVASETKLGTATLTVTDTGNGNAITDRTAEVEFIFENFEV